MPATSPTRRRRIARRAAKLRASAPGYDGRAATAPARAGYWAKYEAQVDPQGTLSPAERRRRALLRWQADMEGAKLARRA